MDSFFQNLFSPHLRNSFQQQYEQAQAYAHQAMDPQTQQPRAVPPASSNALRQLPQITVTPDDLSDPCNRECCICLDSIEIDDTVTRLPCAHLFHPNCIQDWLTQHACTCPVCRYELETSNADYERGRKQRMQSRNLRFAKHELDRMSLDDLKRLARQCNVPVRVPPSATSTTKTSAAATADLVQAIIQSGKVDIIASPPPVEYALQELRDMSISQLKQCMAQAGVFFHAKDVLEKEDMVRIFYNSGRLVLRGGVYSSGYGTLDGYTVSVVKHDRPRKRSVLVETVMDETQELRRPRHLEDYAFCMFGEFSRDEMVPEEEASMANEFNTATDTTDRSEHMDDTASDVYEHMASMPEQIHHVESPPPPISPSPHDEFTNTTIADLKSLARRANVDLSHCLERQEMIDQLILHGASIFVQPSDFTHWSVSGLRALCHELQVDYSPSRETMVMQLVEAARQGHHVANYLNVLMPLAELTVPQLRAVARDWTRNVSDCLEKEELIHRLVAGFHSRHTFDL